jgi:hypothetical protein
MTHRPRQSRDAQQSGFCLHLGGAFFSITASTLIICAVPVDGPSRMIVEIANGAATPIMNGSEMPAGRSTSRDDQIA